MRISNKLIYTIIFITFLTTFCFSSNFGIPGWVNEYLKDFVNAGFLQQKAGYDILRLNSRIMIAREVNHLLEVFTKKPQNFSTSEVAKLGHLSGEFSEELRVLNNYDIKDLTVTLKLLRNKILTNKSVVLTSQFHNLGKKEGSKSNSPIVHRDVIKAEVHTDKAKKLYYMGKYSKALLELNSAISKYPKYLPGYFWLGRVYVRKGEYFKAINCWEKVVNSLGNKIYINDFVEKTSQYNEVFMDILEVLSAYPENKTANFMLKTLQKNLRRS